MCGLCGQSVPNGSILRHWQLACPETPRSTIERRYTDLATAIVKPEADLLTVVWGQIEDILVETGFVR